LLLGDGHESGVQLLVTTGVQNQNLLSERVRRGPHAINFLVRIPGNSSDYVLAPRVLSREEWIEQYSGDKGPGRRRSDAAVSARLVH